MMEDNLVSGKVEDSVVLYVEEELKNELERKTFPKRFKS